MRNYSSEKKKNGMEREKKDGRKKREREEEKENQPRIPHFFFNLRYCLTPLNGCE